MCTITSAGILCYSYVPGTNNLYFLLAQDDNDNKYKCSNWSDLGGRVETGESIYDTAARECIEESMALIDMSLDIDDTAKEDRETNSVDEYSESDEYSERDEEYSESDEYSEYSGHSSSSSDDEKYNFKSYFVTAECIFTDFDRLRKDLRDREFTYCITDTNKFSTKSIERICFLKRIRWQPRLSEKFSYFREHLLQLKNICDIYHQQPHAQQFYEQMLLTYAKLPTDVKQHPCIEIITHPILDIYVDPSYLEKRALQWWSFPTLKQVQRKKGIFKQHKFRKGFMQTLSWALNKMGKHCK